MEEIQTCELILGVYDLSQQLIHKATKEARTIFKALQASLCSVSIPVHSSQ